MFVFCLDLPKETRFEKLSVALLFVADVELPGAEEEEGVPVREDCGEGLGGRPMLAKGLEEVLIIEVKTAEVGPMRGKSG